MSRHLLATLGQGEHTLLSVSSPEGPWWILAVASPEALLSDLDKLLRETWFEAAGHQSDFTIKGVHFEDSPLSGWMASSRSADVEIESVLPTGTVLTYRYDFTNTTHLHGKALGLVNGGNDHLTILARNDDVAWPCRACDNEANAVCSACGAFSCGCTDACPACGASLDQVAIPVINSPRMGIGGFRGPGEVPSGEEA
ncbi:MAG: hypothetical protein JXX28_04185 [Deltaproteobacteria bacterium]|nr:hypothetical protein [Deltaproteobacteria bacterium]